MKILINAGPTRESLDPVRFITNHSSGKMGYAIAKAAVEAGHEVTLVSGPVNIQPPPGLEKFISITTAAEMAEEMKKEFPSAQLTILSAAVADYRPKTFSGSKIKKQEGSFFLELERTEDIAGTLGERKSPSQKLIGFAAETDDLEANALAKLEKKNFDGIAANKVGIEGQGFGSENNAIIFYSRKGTKKVLSLKSKELLARELLETILED